MDNDRPLRISELEAMSGIGRSTIHYYLREGLLSPPRRTGKTMAYYTRSHLSELAEIRRLQEEGYPISFIREMMGSSRKSEGVDSPVDEAESRSERRQQIMDRAVEMFARKGYHQTNITDITRAVGVGHSTFYIYFSSKRALFMECLEEVFQAMFSDVWEEIKNEKDPLKRLRKRGEVVLKGHPQFLDILNVLRTIVEDDPSLESRRKEIYASIVEPVRRDIVRAMDKGLIPRVDADIASYVVVGFLETASVILSLNGGYEVDDLLDAMEKMLFPEVGGASTAGKKPAGSSAKSG